MKNILFCLIAALLPCMASAQYADHRNRRVDSLELLLTASPPTGKDLLNVYRGLFWGYLQTDMEKSMYYARKHIHAALRLDAFPDAAEGYTILGMHHWASSQYDSSALYYGKALEAAEQTRNFPKKYNEREIEAQFAMTYGNMGNLYNIQGKYPEAIDYYTRALRYYEKYGINESQSIACMNIGEMYIGMDNYRQAGVHFFKMDSLAHVTGDSLHIAYAKRRLSKIYLHDGDYDKALQSVGITYAYVLSHPEEGDAGKLDPLIILSEIWLEGYGDYRRAEEYAREALALADAVDMPREKASSLRVLSTIHLKRGEWRRAEQTALEALEADDSEPANTLAVYEILAKAYAHQGNAPKADEYFDRHNALQATWSNRNYQSSIREMEVKYETEKKETQIEALASENRLMASEKRLMIWLGVSCGAALLLALSALFLLLRWTVQKRQHAETRILQLEQEKQLVAAQSLLDGEIKERARLARDLHDGLGSILTGAKMILTNLKNDVLNGTGDASGFDNATEILNDSIHEMRRIAHHLMPDALSRFGLKPAISDFCDTLPPVKFVWYGSTSRLDPYLEGVIYRITHELINNALRHSAASHILVQFAQEADRIALVVQDNGTGFDPQAAGGGTGLSNVRTRVASFGGFMSISSNAGEGTEVNVEFKLRIEN
jgi:signal transduction histidine kinase